MAYLDDVIGGYFQELDAREEQKAYFNDPALWAKERLGINLWWKQKEVANAIVTDRNVAVKAGHGVGKSYLAAVLSCWWVDTRPINRVFLASTAPSADQVTAVIWRNIRQLHQLSHKLAAADKSGKTKPLPGRVSQDNKWKDDLGNLIGQGRKPPDQKAADAFQGIHDGYVLATGDEACGLSEEMIDGLANITSNENSRRFLIGNPTNPASYFAKIFAENTGAWKLLTISVLDSPPLHGGGRCQCHRNEPWGLGMDEVALSELSGEKFIEEKRLEFGEDSPRFKARVLGEFAYDDAQLLFDDFTINRSRDAIVNPDPGMPYRVLGVDVARQDKDSTYIYMAEHGTAYSVEEEPDASGNPVLGGPRTEDGEELRGLRLRHIDHWKDVPFVDRTDYRTGQVTVVGQARRIHDYAMQLGVQEVRIDASGMGKGLIDGVEELSEDRYLIIEVWGSQPSRDRRAWTNIRAYHFDYMRKMMSQGRIDIDPNDKMLLDELGGIQYEFADGSSGGGMKIESKESMKKRGKKSPDAADAAWYACADFSGLTDGPMAGLKAGDVVREDLTQYTPSPFYDYTW